MTRVTNYGEENDTNLKMAFVPGKNIIRITLMPDYFNIDEVKESPGFQCSI